MPKPIRLSLDRIQDTLWAIQDGKLDEINAVVEALLTGKTPPLMGDYLHIGADAAKLALNAGPEGNAKPYNVEQMVLEGKKQRVAIIPVYNTIMKRANLFALWSGGTSSQIVMNKIKAALADEDVDAIALDVDSPGGAVDGTKTLADFIFNSRGKKPIVAYSDGTVASAAYWIASACDNLFISQTSAVGSIGVRLTHYDMSGQDKANGVVRTTIFAGKYKAIADDNGPLSKEGREYLQGMVDKTYEAFVSDVARNRGVSVEEALKMADGKVFIGPDAVKAGLADGIGLLDAALGRASIQSKRSAKMDKLEQLEAQLAAANEKIAGMEKAQADTMAQIEAEKVEAAKREGELVAKARKEAISATITRLVSEGKVSPASVDAGLLDFMVALDNLGEAEIKGEKVNAVDWFTKNFAEEKIVTLGEHTATDKSAGATGVCAEEKEGLRIAATVNRDIKVD